MAKDDKTLRTILERIEVAEGSRKAKHEDKWRDCYRRFRSLPEGKREGSNIFVPYTFMQCAVVQARIASSMFANRPYVTVLPREDADMEQAELLQILVDWQLEDRMNIRQSLGEEVMQSLIVYGTGITYTGWKVAIRKMKYPEIREAPLADQFTNMPMQDETGRIITVPEREIVEEERAVYDDPIVQCIDLFDFFCDPYAADIGGARYCGHKEYQTKAQLTDLVKQGKYKIDFKTLAPVTVEKAAQVKRGDGPGEDTGDGDSPAFGMYLVHHYWEDNRHVVIINRKQIALNEENPFWHGQKPYDKCCYQPLSGEFYGVGIPEMCAGLQDELNTSRNQRVDYNSMAIRRMFKVRRGSGITQEDLVWRQGGVIQVNDPADVLEINIQELPASAFANEDNIEQAAIDWEKRHKDASMAPIPTAINIGASLYNELKGVDGLSEQDVLHLVAAVLSAPVSDVTQDSLWQGVVDFMGYVGDGDIQGAVTEMAGNLATQMVPCNSFLQAVARIADPYRRETSAQGEMGWVTNRILSDIPGLSQNLPESHNVFGEAEKRFPVADGAAGRAIWSAFVPFAAARDRSMDATEQARQALYADTGDKSLFPTVAPYTVQYEGNKYPVRGSERSAWQQEAGQSLTQILQDMIASPEYKKASTEEKLKMFKDAQTFTTSQAKQEFLSGQGAEYTPDQWIGNAKDLEQAGVSHGEYILIRTVLSSLDQAADKRRFLFDLKSYTPEQKKALDGAFIHDGVYIPRAVDADYSGGESFLISQLSATGQRNWPKAQAWGLAADQYAQLYPIAAAGKKKAEVLANLLAVGFNQQQAEYFYKLANSK